LIVAVDQESEGDLSTAGSFAGPPHLPAAAFAAAGCLMTRKRCANALPDVVFAHDRLQNPVSTFRDHAPAIAKRFLMLPR
jgi:hypothetical protein